MNTLELSKYSVTTLENTEMKQIDGGRGWFFLEPVGIQTLAYIRYVQGIIDGVQETVK